MHESEHKQYLTEGYDATLQHWTHAEDTRWSLLNNYFTGSSILILAWAALFTSHAPYRRLLSAVLASSGVFISLLWAGLSHRANGFVNMYTKLGIRLEEEFGKKLALEQNSPFPFMNAEKHRSTLGCPARCVNSRFTVVAVPFVFALIYVFLAWVAIASPRLP